MDYSQDPLEIAKHAPARYFNMVVENSYDDIELEVINDIIQKKRINESDAINEANQILLKCKTLKDEIINFIKTKGGYRKLKNNTKKQQRKNKARKTLRK